MRRFSVLSDGPFFGFFLTSVDEGDLFNVNEQVRIRDAHLLVDVEQLAQCSNDVVVYAGGNCKEILVL